MILSTHHRKFTAYEKIFFLLALLIVLPVSTHAAWYNPRDWFKTEQKTGVAAQTVAATTTDEVPVKPTVIEKTVTVQDPSLLNRIAALEKENTELKARIAVLMSQISAPKPATPSEIAPTAPVLDTLSPGCQEIRELYFTTLTLREEAGKEAETKLNEFIAGIKKENSLTNKRIAELKGDVQTATGSYNTDLKLLEDRFIRMCPGKSMI